MNAKALYLKFSEIQCFTFYIVILVSFFYKYPWNVVFHCHCKYHNFLHLSSNPEILNFIPPNMPKILHLSAIQRR